MRVTKRQMRNLIREALLREMAAEGQQLEFDLEQSETWEYMNDFIEAYPQLANKLTMIQFKDLHKKAWNESLDVGRDPAALAELGHDRRPQLPEELNDLLMKLMARQAGVQI